MPVVVAIDATISFDVPKNPHSLHQNRLEAVEVGYTKAVLAAQTVEVTIHQTERSPPISIVAAVCATVVAIEG